MRSMMALLALPALGACQTVPEAGMGHCNAREVQRFVGALGTRDISRVLIRRSGAKTLRWLTPDSAATMDYRRDRLNVRVDGRNFITGLDCG